MLPAHKGYLGATDHWPHSPLPLTCAIILTGAAAMAIIGMGAAPPGAGAGGG